MIPSCTGNRPWRLALLSVVGLAAGVFCWGAPAPERPAVEPIPFPDGVTDAQRRTAFVSSPDGGIQAIRLEDGKALWSNSEVAAVPWLATGGRLIARGERILVLDRQNGKLLRRCDAPDYPRVKVPERCTVSFNLWEGRVRGDVLEAKWYAVALIDRSKGRPFAFEAWTAFNKAAPVGTVKVNLDSGRVEVQTDAQRADLTMDLMPGLAKPGSRPPTCLSDKLTAEWQRYHRDQNGRIAVVDGRLVGVALILEQAGTEYFKKVVLNSWDLKTGAAAEPVELVKDRALSLANVMLTADRRHAAVQFSTSELSVYSLPDGKRVAKGIKGASSPENAFVDGRRLYSVEPTGQGGGRVLRAIDLRTGKLAWDRPVRPMSTIPLPP